MQDIISNKTLFLADDSIQRLEEVKGRVVERREKLREKAADEESIDEASIVDLTSRRENIIAELLRTECNYVEDLKLVLRGYRDKMEMSNVKVTFKTDRIFGNLDEICEFHSCSLLPQLQQCGLLPHTIARTFLEHQQQLTRLYCRYCGNMEQAQVALGEVGDNHPILLGCQRELGHQVTPANIISIPSCHYATLLSQGWVGWLHCTTDILLM